MQKFINKKMTDTYYIIITVIFGIFVLVTAWWVYRYMKSTNPLTMTYDELSDQQKAFIYKFCRERKEQQAQSNSVKTNEKVEKKTKSRRK